MMEELEKNKEKEEMENLRPARNLTEWLEFGLKADGSGRRVRPTCESPTGVALRGTLIYFSALCELHCVCLPSLVCAANAMLHTSRCK